MAFPEARECFGHLVFLSFDIGNAEVDPASLIIVAGDLDSTADRLVDS